MSLCLFAKSPFDGGGSVAIEADSIVMVEESTDDVTYIHVLDWEETIKVKGSYIETINLIDSRKSRQVK